MNKNIAVIGAIWGDEAKGAITHRLSRDFDYVVKYSGGNNTGHTVYNNGVKFAHHLTPAINYGKSDAKGFLASGMVIDLFALRKELEDLEKIFPGVSQRIIIDPDNFIVEAKDIEEDLEKNSRVGSTGKGIGIAYRNKVDRKGIKIRNLISNGKPIITELKDMGVQFKYILEMQKELANSKLLFEGSQSILLTIASGTYPYVSCGDCEISGILSSGFGFAMPEKIIGVSKGTYTTRACAPGPFPTEMPEDEAKHWREVAGEYGSTTSKPRRIGYMDLVALKYAVRRGNINSLALTKLDIYNGVEKIKVAVYYDRPIYSGSDFEGAIPSYTELPGWKDCKDPKQVAHYIKFVEEYVGVKVEYITTGIGEKDIIRL